MLGKLKTELARYPLSAFLAVAIAAPFVIGALSTVRARWPLPGPGVHVGDLGASIAGLAALVCCWALSKPDLRRRSPQTRLVIVAAVTASCLVLLVAKALLLQLALFGHVTAAIVRGLPVGTESRAILSSPTNWLAAIAAGVVLSGVVSSWDVVRRLARSLIAWREPGVPRLMLVALLAPAALAVFAVAGAHVAPAGGSTSWASGPTTYLLGGPALDTLRSSPAYAAVNLLCLLGLGMPGVLAWYGFAAERLGRRLSPLVVGVLIGLATALPVVVVKRLLDIHFGVSSPYLVGAPLAVALNVAVAVLAVWLTRRAQGSLLPAALLLTSVTVAGYGALWTGAAGAQGARAATIYVWATIVFVAAVTLLGRLWQRSSAGPTPAAAAPAPGAPGPAPAPGSFEVVVRDLGMPL
jgi:hypothetical protein